MTTLAKRRTNCRANIQAVRELIHAIEWDLSAITDAGDHRSLVAHDFGRLVDLIDELADGTREVRERLRQKRINGEAADRNIDAVIEASK